MKDYNRSALKLSTLSIRGFTALELLMVMAIIAIIISIAIPSFRGMQKEARKEKALAGIRTLKMAVESYYNNHDDVFPPGNRGATWESYLTTAYPAIIEAPVYDPLASGNTTQFIYHLSPNSLYYIIYSVGFSGVGAASINTTGNVLVTGDAIWGSNGPSQYP